MCRCVGTAPTLPPRRGHGTRCALWPALWVQLLCSATGPLGGKTLLVIALSRVGGKSHLLTDCKAWRAHYHTAGFKATNRQPKQYQPFFPAVPLQDFKALPQDQTDQLKTDNLCYKGREGPLGLAERGDQCHWCGLDPKARKHPQSSDLIRGHKMLTRDPHTRLSLADSSGGDEAEVSVHTLAGCPPSPPHPRDRTCPAGKPAAALGRPPAPRRAAQANGARARPHHAVLVQAQPVDALPLAVHGLPEGLNEQVLCGEQKPSSACLPGARAHTARQQRRRAN